MVMPSSTTTSDTGPPETAASRTPAIANSQATQQPGRGRRASPRAWRDGVTGPSDELEHGFADGFGQLRRGERIAVADRADEDRCAELHAPRCERQAERTAGPHPHRDHRVAERG